MGEVPGQPYYGSARYPAMALAIPSQCPTDVILVEKDLEFEEIVNIAQFESDEKVTAAADLWQRIHDLMDQLGRDFRTKTDQLLGIDGEHDGWGSDGAAGFVTRMGDALQTIDAWRDAAGHNVGQLRALASAISTFQAEVRELWIQHRFVPTDTPGRRPSLQLRRAAVAKLRTLDKAFEDAVKVGDSTGGPNTNGRPSLAAGGFSPGPVHFTGPTNARLVPPDELMSALMTLAPRATGPGTPIPPPPSPTALASAGTPPPVPTPTTPAAPPRPSAPSPPPSLPPITPVATALAPVPPLGPFVPRAPVNLPGTPVPARFPAPNSPIPGGRDAPGPTAPPRTPRAPTALSGRHAHTPENSSASHPPSPQLPGRTRGSGIPAAGDQRRTQPDLPSRSGHPTGSGQPPNRPQLLGRSGDRSVAHPTTPSFGAPEMPRTGRPGAAQPGTPSLRGRQSQDPQRNEPGSRGPRRETTGAEVRAEVQTSARAHRPAAFAPPSPIQNALAPPVSTMNLGSGHPSQARYGGFDHEPAAQAGLTGRINDQPHAPDPRTPAPSVTAKPSKKDTYETNATDQERVWSVATFPDDVIAPPTAHEPTRDQHALGGARGASRSSPGADPVEPW